jgi:hypothetical protein
LKYKENNGCNALQMGIEIRALGRLGTWTNSQLRTRPHAQHMLPHYSQGMQIVMYNTVLGKGSAPSFRRTPISHTLVM